jgi:hypothetical protein
MSNNQFFKNEAYLDFKYLITLKNKNKIVAICHIMAYILGFKYIIF